MGGVDFVGEEGTWITLLPYWRESFSDPAHPTHPSEANAMSADTGSRGPPSPSGPEITVPELLRRTEDGHTFQAMDIRAPSRLEQGRLDLIPPERYQNIRGSRLREVNSSADTGLDPELPVVVICSRGKDSGVLATHLNSLGFDARSLAGGLVEWMTLVHPIPLDPPQGVDRMLQFDRRGKGCLGYLLESRGEALLVDPPFRFQPYLDALGDSGARLVGVADTHIHADYVSGAPLLAKRFGVPYYLHPDDAVYPYDGTPGKIEFHPVQGGDTISFGRATVRVMHTPGHTEGSVTYLLEERAAFTGDFLFVESIGRPDLGGKEEEWARLLWDSMSRAIRDWGDGMAIYPAHYASGGERRMGRAVGIPFGDLLRENDILRIQDPEVFLRTMVAAAAPFPESYRKIRALNVGLAPIVESEVEELEVGRNECALGGDVPK